jgi:hypothetical protein
MKIGRLGFYISVIVFAVVVWRTEVFIQNRPQVYGELISDLSPLQEKQLGAFLEMNRLLITLGTALLGAMGFLLVNAHKARSSARQLSPAFASAFFVGLSIYYGYRAYEDLVIMLQPPDPTFDLNGYLIAWDRHAHFFTFLLGVFFFADFAFRQLTREDGRG